MRTLISYIYKVGETLSIYISFFFFHYNFDSWKKKKMAATDYDQRKYDIGKILIYYSHWTVADECRPVVFGATGFTGALTCEYLAEIQDKVNGTSNWQHLPSCTNTDTTGSQVGYCWS